MAFTQRETGGDWIGLDCWSAVLAIFLITSLLLNVGVKVMAGQRRDCGRMTDYCRPPFPVEFFFFAHPL